MLLFFLVFKVVKLMQVNKLVKLYIVIYITIGQLFTVYLWLSHGVF